MMECNHEYCGVEIKPEPCPKCGRFPYIKVNNLTAWLKCPKCGRCAVGGDKEEAIRNWNGANVRGAE